MRPRGGTEVMQGGKALATWSTQVPRTVKNAWGVGERGWDPANYDAIPGRGPLLSESGREDERVWCDVGFPRGEGGNTHMETATLYRRRKKLAL